MGGGACVPCLPRSVQHLTLLTTKENEQVSIMASRNKIQSRREELVVMHISTQATPPLRGHQVQMLFLVNRNKNLKKIVAFGRNDSFKLCTKVSTSFLNCTYEDIRIN